MSEAIEKKGFIECLSNFMSDSEGLTQEDLLAELQGQNVDVDKLKTNVAELVKRGSEEMRLGWKKRAKQKRIEIEKLLGMAKTIPVAPNDTKDEMMRFIKDSFGTGALTHAEAYFRNQENLSESDIIKLLEDLEKLEYLEKSRSEKDS